MAYSGVWEAGRRLCKMNWDWRMEVAALGPELHTWIKTE